MGYRIQNRRDTAERWAEINPVLLDGEMGIVTDKPNQYKVGDGIHAWNDLPLRGFNGTIAPELGYDENAVASQKVVTEKFEEQDSKISELGSNFGAFSGYAKVHLNKLYDFDAEKGTGYLNASSTYDCVFLRILEGSTKLTVTGATPKFFIYFDTPYVKENDYIGYNINGNIPVGAKFCVIDFAKADNAEGYDNMRIRQEGGGADKIELDKAKSELTEENNILSFNQSFALNEIAPSIVIDEESIPYEVIQDKFYSEQTHMLKENTNYDCWKANVSDLRNPFLHIITTIYGDIAAISFVDENEEFISDHFKTSDGIELGANRNYYVIVPKKAAYIFVNYNKSYPSKNPGIWKVLRKTKFENDIYPSFVASIDTLSANGKILVVPNACAVVSIGDTTHGNIEWHSNYWHMGVYKLRNNEPLQLVGAKSSIFMFYSSEEFSNETLLGYNSSETQEIPAGAKYCCIDFDSDIYNIESIRATRVNQTNTFHFHEKALRNTKQVLIERDYSKDTELYNHGLLRDGSFEESEYDYGISIFNIDDFPKYVKIAFSGRIYGPTNYSTFAYYDKNSTLLMSEKKDTGEGTHYNMLELNAPEGTAKIAVLYFRKSFMPTLYGFVKEEYNSVANIKNDFTNLKEKALKSTDIVIPVFSKNIGLRYFDKYSELSTFYNNEYLISEIDLKDGERLLFTAGIHADTQIDFIVFLDEEGNAIGGQHRYGTAKVVNYDLEIIIPEKAYKMIINSANSWTVSLIKRKYESFTEDIDTISNALEKVSEKTEILMTEKKEGYFISSSGEDKANSFFHIDIYSIDGIEYDYLYASGGIGPDTQLSIANYYDGDNRYLGRDLVYSEPIRIDSAKILPPKGTAIVKLVSDNSNTTKLEFATKEGFYNSGELNKKIESIEKELGNSDKLMKVVLSGTEPSNGSRVFYIRTKYNKTKDIILDYYINNNTLISPNAAYVGDNNLTDSQIMKSANRMSYHSDSTAPLFNSSVYWHLFAQHGYPVPRISNAIGMTSNDVGAVWKDQINREYTIGDVTDDIVTLLPIIYKDENGNDTRGWKTPNSTAITSLTHVSGGVYVSPFETTNLSGVQLRPIMNHSNRVFLIDGKEVKETGTYYCDDFKVSESQVGYDPASINTWFPLPVLDGANEMARFTWSYNFKGAQCCVNTTIDIRTRVECQSYGATQQQTFFDNGNYKAMFMIPKAASRNGVELDKPFNSSTTSSPDYSFYRTSKYLKDVDDPIDRLIGFLHNPTDDTYLFGMAAGLSLVSGDTVKEKRVANMPMGDKNGHYRVGLLSPSNTNKFYVAAINTAPYEEDNYHFPTTLFKEINYYVSYFDPSENVGQVYWYKDGSNYVIYMHCQSEQNKLAINLPDFMEGLKVDIVEKTDGATLLTDVIQNGKLYVNYNGDANYIVVKTV